MKSSRAVFFLLLLISEIFSGAVYAAPKRQPLACPAFNQPQDVLSLTIDGKQLHVVSDDRPEVSMSSFPVFLIPGGPGYCFALRTIERDGSAQIKINSGCGG